MLPQCKEQTLKTYDEELADEGIYAGVEKEIDDEYLTQEPFNPEDISISSKVVALDTIIRRIKNNTIKLAPDFQREFVWDKKRKSQLIESMVLKIPLPMFYVSEDKNGIWEVVDGLQRLSTIRDFVIGPDGDGKGDVLKKLEFLGDALEGKDFFRITKDEKASRMLNNIMESELSFTVINPGTPEKVKRNIFKRINTGGMRLSDQEIRHALYQGVATKLLHELVISDSYIRATQNSVKDNRMAGRELILRFLSFYILGRSHLKSSMDDFLSNTMRLINGERIEDIDVGVIEIDELTRSFNLGVLRSHEMFGEHTFRNSTPFTERKAPINKALFEMWINIFAKMDEVEYQELLINKSLFLRCYYKLLEDQEFINSISRYGSSASGANERYSKTQTLLSSYMENDND